VHAHTTGERHLSKVQPINSHSSHERTRTQGAEQGVEKGARPRGESKHNARGTVTEKGDRREHRSPTVCTVYGDANSARRGGGRAPNKSVSHTTASKQTLPPNHLPSPNVVGGRAESVGGHPDRARPEATWIVVRTLGDLRHGRAHSLRNQPRPAVAALPRPVEDKRPRPPPSMPIARLAPMLQRPASSRPIQ